MRLCARLSRARSLSLGLSSHRIDLQGRAQRVSLFPINLHHTALDKGRGKYDTQGAQEKL